MTEKSKEQETVNSSIKTMTGVNKNKESCPGEINSMTEPELEVSNKAEEAVEETEYQHLSNIADNQNIRNGIRGKVRGEFNIRVEDYNATTGDFLFESREFGSRENANLASPVIAIPNADEIKSSPEISFGQDTLNMVDEFMKSEAIAQRSIKKRSVASRILRRLFCC